MIVKLKRKNPLDNPEYWMGYFHASLIHAAFIVTALFIASYWI